MERVDVCNQIWISSRRCVEVLILYCRKSLCPLRADISSYIKLLLTTSGSMEPAFQRGDILFLNNQDSPIRVGEIVVFKIKDRDIPIVHRVMKVHEKEDGKVRHSALLCKDNYNRQTSVWNLWGDVIHDDLLSQLTPFLTYLTSDWSIDERWQQSRRR